MPEINPQFLNMQFTQTAFRNAGAVGVPLSDGELRRLVGLPPVTGKYFRKRIDDFSELICNELLDEEDANMARVDGHRRQMKRKLGLDGEGYFN